MKDEIIEGEMAEGEEDTALEKVCRVQKLYIFAKQIFPSGIFFYAKGTMESLKDGATETEKMMYAYAADVLEIEGVMQVLFSEYGMTVFNDGEHSWEEIEDGLRKIHKKHQLMLPVFPSGVMKPEWGLIRWREKDNVASFMLYGRSFIFHLDGRKFRRDEWQQEISSRWRELEFELRPRGYAVLERIFRDTDASAAIILKCEVVVEFEDEIKEDVIESLKALIKSAIEEME